MPHAMVNHRTMPLRLTNGFDCSTRAAMAKLGHRSIVHQHFDLTYETSTSPSRRSAEMLDGVFFDDKTCRHRPETETLIPAEEKIGDTDGLPPRREPIFNIPGILTAYVAVLVIIHVIRAFILTPGFDQWLVSITAFIPARYLHPIAAQSVIGYFLGPVSYSFLHGGWGHLGSNALFLVIFATPLSARIGPYRFAVLWVSAAIASAFFLAVLTGFEFTFLIGASGVVSATAGASCRFVVPLLGSSRMTAARYAPRLGLIEALTERSVIVFVVIWLMFNVVLAGVDNTANIAWQAHLGGFLFGYLTFGLFDPPIRR